MSVSLVSSGQHVIEQHCNRAPVRPGEILLFESSRPFEAYADGESSSIQFPRALLALPARHVDDLICRPLPADQGRSGWRLRTHHPGGANFKPRGPRGTLLCQTLGHGEKRWPPYLGRRQTIGPPLAGSYAVAGSCAAPVSNAAC
ncbi:AraC-like ligand-binding domain-containing protein [Streptomyces sp. NPDC004096]